MNKEERKCLNDCGFSNVTQLLLAYVSLQQENHKYKEVIDRIQKIINTEIKLMGYAVNDSCLMLIQDILKEME